MNQDEAREQSGEQPMSAISPLATVQSTSSRSGTTVSPQAGAGTCATCGSPMNANPEGGTMYPYVYTLGRVESRFPTVGVEKEFAQATGRAETKGLTNRQALYDVLKQHRYLARQLCYVLTIEGLETYLLQPRDPLDFDLLVEAVRREPSAMDLDCVIGVRGPIAPPDMCNGLMVPIVALDQMYSFGRDSLLNSIPRPDYIPEDQFRATTEELLDLIMQMSDNAGATDEDRALNYLALRYPAIYARAAESHQANASLKGVEVRRSPLSGTRKIVDVIFSFTNRNTDVVDKFSVRVDVTEEFPFLVTKLSPYFDR
jgi:hypothetical protein